ncbi:hypothetical protein COCOBI_11-3800 [Coccomyxa sp. Obi]|nr:hypothetical protein COCOBI_11-3800 [Coccomyxa sp. Obi]
MLAYHGHRNCSIKTVKDSWTTQCTVPSHSALPGLFNMSKSEEKDPDFPYVHLWVSADGETHITEAKMSGFELKKYAQDPQYVKEGPSPSKTVFTQLNAGLKQDFHPCPQVQFVVTLSGKWYVKASDGSVKIMGPGDVLFQDDVKDSPAKKTPGHWSGVVGDWPCQQMIIQVTRKPEVDKPGSL